MTDKKLFEAFFSFNMIRKEQFDQNWREI